MIPSANLAVIDSGTVIQTDPAISRNGETDYGRIFRDETQDGTRTDWLFGGNTSEFDRTSGFEGGFDTSNQLNQFAAFKFPTLQLAGNPTIDTSNGGVFNLGLIAVGNLTTSAPGGTLSFDGITVLLLATQQGSITLGSEVSFDTERMFVYARGVGSNLTIGSSITSNAELRLFSEGTVQVNGAASTQNFSSFSAGDFLAGTGLVSSGGIYLTSLRNINFNAAQFSAGSATDISVSLNATKLLNINPVGGDQTVFSKVGRFDAVGQTINIALSFGRATQGAASFYTIVFNPAAERTRFSAGTGGIQAPEIAFDAVKLELFSAGDINIYASRITPNDEGVTTIAGTISADGLFSASADVGTGNLTAGSTVSVGGNLFVVDVTAGDTITVGGSLSGFGTATAGGDITADSTSIPTIFSPTGTLRVGQGGINPFVETQGFPEAPALGSNLQHTIDISTIVSPAGINFNGNQFRGTDDLFAGGRLTINADTLRFDAEVGVGRANFDGADGLGFDFSPADGKGGDGGIFVANATNGIFVGEQISATTGLNDLSNPDATFGGNGGMVTLDSSAGAVSVLSTIQVSSNDPTTNQTPPPTAARRSARGGDITLHSGLTAGTAIDLTNTSRLLSLLNDSAPGPGGTISITADGGDIFANGQITADRGTISMSNLVVLPPGRPTQVSGNPFPLISIDGSFAVITSEFLNISSAGDIEIGLTTPVQINSVTLNLTAINDIRFGSADLEATAVRSTGDVTINAGQDISAGGDFFLARFTTTEGTPRQDGNNITLTTGAGDFTVTGNAFLQAGTRDFTSGGNISLDIARDVSVTGTLDLAPFGASGTTLGAGGNSTLTVGRNLNADEVRLMSNFGAGVNVGNGARLSLDVGGNVLLSGDAAGISMTVLTAAGKGPPTMLGTGGTISLSVGGSLTGNIGQLALGIRNQDSTIEDGGSITADIGGNVELSSVMTEVRNFAGEITTGGNTALTIGGDFTVGSDVNMSLSTQLGHVGSGGNLALTVSGDFSSQGLLSLRVDASGQGLIDQGGNITGTVGGNLTASNIQFTIDSSGGGSIGNGAVMNLSVTGDLTTNGANSSDANFLITEGPFSTITTNGATVSGPSILVSAANFNIAGSLNAYINDNGENGSPSGAAGTALVTSGGTMAIGGRLNVLGQVTAGSTINARTVSGTDVTSNVSINAGEGGIQQFRPLNEAARPELPHFLTAPVITSVGGINFDGDSASGDFSGATSGGRLTLDAASLKFGPGPGTIDGPVTLNGGDSSSTFEPGNGGILTATTTGALTVDSDIEATSGRVDPNVPESGAGGIVNLESTSDAVSISSRIEVSSNDPVVFSSPSPAPQPRRRSTQGGSIAVKSGRSGSADNRVVAIDIKNSSQLLALLAAAPSPAPGGKIVIRATGADSDVNVKGKVYANGGVVDVRHTGSRGQVNLGGTANSSDTLDLRGNVVKVAAIDDNGVLRIGNSTISADTTLQLYAPGTNGEVRFIRNVTLNGNSTKSIAGRTVTIDSGVLVNVNGPAASVYTDVPNYSSAFGGNNMTTGTFGGSGANPPQPFNRAPPLGDPPGG